MLEIAVCCSFRLLDLKFSWAQTDPIDSDILGKVCDVGVDHSDHLTRINMTIAILA